MSKPIFERYVDERGNISVRVSQDMIVLTQEKAERIEAEYKRMQAENNNLQERITTQKQTIQAYRDESREWREVAERAQSENAELRTQLADVDESMGRVEERYAKTFEVGKRWMAKAARFEAENAKLRELAAGIGHLLFALDVDYCAGCPRDDINHPCPVYTVKGGDCLYETDLRELGVEVDE